MTNSAPPPTLRAATRTVTGKKVQALRSLELIPAVVYGHREATRLIQVPRGVFQRVFTSAGESSLVDLAVDQGAPLKVIIHDVQRDPLTDEVVHVDFYQVTMTEKLTTDVPLRFTGDSRAVKELGGVLVRALDHLKVECLPQDLVPEIVVDLGSLAAFGDALHVRDLPVPPALTVLSHAGDIVVSVQAPRSEEPVGAAVAASDVSQVEVEKKGKREEGAADAPAEAKEE